MVRMVEFYRTQNRQIMKKNYLALISTVLLALGMSGQVSTYVFSQLSGTYTAITGGTVFGNTTSDDQVFVDPTIPLGSFSGATGPGIPIGFNFTYNNFVVDRFGINNNGWIFFGQSSLVPPVNSNSSSSYNAISATSTATAPLQNRIAAFSRDMQAQVGGDLRVETIGITPNRICVIQWTNYRKFAATGDNYNMQIRLYETTNVVEVVYGMFVNNASTATAEVGLRGSTNADFNHRSVTTAGNWANSIAGVTNNANVSVNGVGLVPSNGQVYRWTPPSPCSAAPAANAVLSTQTLICPNAGVLLSLSNSYTNTGLAYQWFSSTVSPVGPFFSVPGATLNTLLSGSLQVSTYYNVAITCTLTSLSTTAAAQSVMIAGTTTNSVPYEESFEGISLNNQLPNCSWVATSPSLICQTYTLAGANNRIPRSGTKFGAFRFGTNVNGDVFYTNGIQMEPGITYSATVWYITDGLPGWQNLSIGLSTVQAAASLTNIASVQGVPSGQFYQALTNTFVVNASGLYYLGIRCTANSVPQFLSFDDISITAPCSLNSPSLSIVSSGSVICQNETIVLNALSNGELTWPDNSTGNVYSFSPVSSTLVNVISTSTLSNCSTVGSYSIHVQPLPPVSIFAPQSTVCAGSPLNLYGFGANTYTWSTGNNGSALVVTPAASTIYTVLAGWSANACIGSATQAVNALALPQIFAGSSRENGMCTGETATLTVAGQNLSQFSWTSNNITINSPIAVIAPNTTTTYSLLVTNQQGCSTTTVLTQVVSACTSLSETSVLDAVLFYPNPTSSTVKGFNLLPGTRITLSDISGRQLLSQNVEAENMELDLSGLSKGIYFITLKTEQQSRLVKVVRD